VTDAGAVSVDGVIACVAGAASLVTGAAACVTGAVAFATGAGSPSASLRRAVATRSRSESATPATASRRTRTIVARRKLGTYMTPEVVQPTLNRLSPPLEGIALPQATPIKRNIFCVLLLRSLRAHVTTPATTRDNVPRCARVVLCMLNARGKCVLRNPAYGGTRRLVRRSAA
jgi:hypothetical protein